MDGSAKEAKATLATAPNADIMREVLCSLRMRIAAGSATFLIKVKSHRGELTHKLMSRRITWLMRVDKKRMTRVRGQHELGEWFLRKRANIVERSLCGQGAFAT